MCNLTIQTLYFDDLTEEEQDDQPDNGAGKENASYLKVTFKDGTTEIFSDAMEPEDVRFCRDLSWIAPLLKKVASQ